MNTGPVVSAERVVALDILRGLAIFGILVVNVLQMFIPEFLADDPTAVIPGEHGMWLSWFVTDAFFANKFLTLFSLLFGAGFCLQWLRVRDRRAFRRIYLRRLAALACFGLVHGLFFYWADVLVIYAQVALAFLALKNWSARRMLGVGGVLLTITMAWGAFIEGPGSNAAEVPAQQLEVAEAMQAMREGGPISIDLEQMSDREPELRRFSVDDHEENRGSGVYDLPMPGDVAILVLGGDDPVATSKVEYAVCSEGPARAAVFYRFSNLSALLVLYTPLYLGWRTLALFLVAGGMVKWGYLDPRRAELWRQVVIVGASIGLPMTVPASILRGYAHLHAGRFATAGHVLHDISSILLAAALASAVLIWGAGGLGSRLRRGLSNVGRTALTNYIGQSVVMSLIATSYGLGLFGDLTRLQLLGLSVVCFGFQIVASSLWLEVFRYGPLEWVWRCATYWRLLPIR